jgi:hypothetical protein
LGDALVIEDAKLALINNFKELLTAGGRVGDIELNSS